MAHGVARARFAAAAIVVVLGCRAGAESGSGAAGVAEWPAYGGDVGGGRFSSASQINRQNVARLAVAWRFSTGDSARFARSREDVSFETTPLVVDGTMYLTSPFGRVFALDPATGQERWRFDARVDPSAEFGDFTNRGVSLWLDSTASPRSPCRRRVILATVDARLFALDAVDGKPCSGFGDNGVIDLRRGLRNAPDWREEYEVTSPPAVINDLIVTGSAVADNSRTDAASGEVRAFDARTGALKWSWDPIPQDSTDPAWHTWQGPRAHSTGAANAWSVIAADPARDLVFVPTGSASPDYFGGERLGDNRYANSVVALRASTGKVVWHFQVVHHDLWDYDVASPPALVTIDHEGQPTPAVLVTTKTGQMFVLHRETGVPLVPVEERPVPASRIPGEVAARTQPFSALPLLSPHGVSADSAWGLGDADRGACRNALASLWTKGVFTPPDTLRTLVIPANIGGAHWGGVAFDPVRQIAVVPTNRIAATVQLIPRARVDPDTMPDDGAEYTDMRGTPYVMRRDFVMSPAGLPCTPLPWGALVAVDLRARRILWQVPLGSLDELVRKKANVGLPPGAGAPNLGGAIVTAGGLVFVAATPEGALHAFDIETGEELWTGKLPAGGKATPMTYQLTKDGPQYVVIAAGGDGDYFGRADEVIAFAVK